METFLKSTSVRFGFEGGIRFLITPVPRHCLLFLYTNIIQSFIVCCLAHRGSTGDSLSLQISVVLFGFPGISSIASVESSSLILHDTLCDVFVYP